MLIITLPGATGAQNAPEPVPAIDFIDSVHQYLYQSSSENVRSIADAFKQIWDSDLGLAHKDKVKDQVHFMIEKNYGMASLTAYFDVLVIAVNDENLDSRKLTDYINVTGKVIEKYPLKDLKKYLDVIRTFFIERALYYYNTSQWAANNVEYEFEFEEGTAPVEIQANVETEPEPEPEPETEFLTEEDLANDDGWGTDSWASDNTDDGWGNDSWGAEDPSEKSSKQPQEKAVNVQTEEHLLNALLQPEPQPPLSGPILRLTKADLSLMTVYDSVQITNTKGAFLLLDDVFLGEGGQFTWDVAGLPGDSVFANFTKYNFDVKKTGFEAEQAKLTHKGKFDGKIDGGFEYQSKRVGPGNERSYPKFTSYSNKIKLKNLGDDLLRYTGGFTLEGTHISSKSVLGGLSLIHYYDAAGLKFKARAGIFNFEDSLISTNESKLTIYHKYDSIYHPVVRVKYDIPGKQLIVQKDKGGFKNHPFQSSYLNMDFKADIIRWDVETDTLEISRLTARNEIPALFASIDYYSPQDYKGLKGYSDFNPLWVLIHYSRKINSGEFYVFDVAKFAKKDQKLIKSAMVLLNQAGLIDYEASSGLISLKRKAYHMAMSSQNRKDYDNLRIYSLIDNKPNAVFDLNNQEMVINGIDRFYISKVLDVYIEPDSNQIVLTKNRGFHYDGHLYAGNFEYVGKDFTFNYDSFFVHLNKIEEINFYILEETSRGSRRRKVDNSLSGASAPADSTAGDMENFTGTSGTLYINKPNNKSGIKLYPNYPRFDGSGSGSIVFFDKKDYLNGAYDRSFYFVVPPFKLDSLSDSDPSSIGFDGTFYTGGMFPEFKEKLRIMPDFSLGFDHSIPPEGYELFGQYGRIYNKLTLDKNGLRGYGKLDFLTATFNSEDFIFYPDSVTTVGTSFDIREDEYGGIRYPRIHGENYKMLWLTRKDSMYLSSRETPLELYENTATLDGTATLTKKGVNGMGTLLTRGSETVSREYDFEYDRFRARHADFEVQSNDPEKPALAANDVRVNFNLVRNEATVSPEIEGTAALEFPYAQFKTSIPEATWLLDSGKIIMEKPSDVEIENSYFYTLREDLDSLSFSATSAVYDINDLELKVSGIPYIIVADAKVTPENGEVLILENSKIGTLKNTRLVIDTLNGFHQLYDGTVTIVSRNEFYGEATYQLVNAVSDTFAIKLTNFHLEEFKESRDVEKHTVAEGIIQEEDDLIISPGMFYRGNVKMIAHKPALELDGFVKLDLKNIEDYNTWIKYRSSAEQQEVVFNFDESVNENGQKLMAGLHFDGEDNSLYSTFIYDKKDPADEDFFKPGGYLSFNPDSNEYIIIERDKEEGQSFKGKVFAYNETNGDIRLEGPVNFIENSKSSYINASVIGNGNLKSSEFEFNTMMSIGFDLPNAIYQRMSEELIRIIKELGAPDGLGDRTLLLYKMAELIGDNDTKAYEERSVSEYTPLFSVSNNLVQPLVFSDVQLKWSNGQKAFYSKGLLGISNILRNDINASFEGFLEIRKDYMNEGLDLFIKAAAGVWYHFSFENNNLIVYSSDKEFNEIVASKSNAGKAKIGEFRFIPGDKNETLAFVNRFRSTYYGIDEPYDLSAPIENLQEEEEFEEEPVEDEGFEVEEEDNDGF